MNADDGNGTPPRTRLERQPGNAAPAATHTRHGWEQMTSASAELLSPPRKLVLVASVALVLVFVSAIAWAHYAKVTEVTRGVGKIIPASKIQVIQNLEGGIIEEIHVKPGDLVKRGQLLFKIDATGVGSNLEERNERIAGLRSKIARLRAEVGETDLSFPRDLVRSHGNLVAQERALFRTRAQALDAGSRVLTQIIEQRKEEIQEAKSMSRFARQLLEKVKEEIKFTRPLLQSKLTSKVDFIKLETREIELRRDIGAAESKERKAANALEEAKQRLEEQRSKFRSEALAEFNQALVALAALRQEVLAYKDRVARTDVRSPVGGIVKDVTVTTVGQVIGPGKDLAEIVPIDDTLLVEAEIRPSDVAFLHAGQPAKVKITAYDYTIYGDLDATLERIGADAIKNEKDEPVFRIQVRTKRNYLASGGEKLPLVPGMVAEVGLVSRDKTVLDYLFKPFRKIASHALQER